MRILSLFLFMLASPGSILAQEWDWELTPYLWSAGIDGDIGLGNLQGSSSMDFSDILDMLAGAALVHAEAQRDQHGFFGDLIYLNLEADDISTPTGTAEVSFETTVIELGYVRNLTNLGLEFGIRYWDFELAINPALVSEVKRDQDWVDGFIGLRSEHSISSNWSFQPRFNIGTGGSDITWGLDLSFSRAFNNGNRVAVGAKVVSFDYDELNVRGIPFLVDVTFTGLSIGYVFD